MNEREQSLLAEIRNLGPWHQNIQLTESLSIMDAYDQEERKRENNNNISLLDQQGRFNKKVEKIFPNGMAGKSFLDCACNAGGYCYWATELGAESAYGFDVRDHWIKQARFVKQHRKVAPVDNIQFDVCDLMKLPEKNLQPADFTLFKGIFYHLADPILGIKIAADLTKEVLLVNTARCFVDNTESLYCIFEKPQNLMSGVHALSWVPSGPSVVGKMLYWLGFTDIWHVYSIQYEDRPKFGRMEIVASRTKGVLDSFADDDEATRVDIESLQNSKQASDEVKALF